MPMLELDRSLFLFLNGRHTPVSDAFWTAMTEHWVWAAFFIPVAYFVFKKYGRQGFWMALAVPLLFLLADQGTNIAKYWFERPRPCREPELQGLVHFLAPHCGLYGFWSAHAANSTAQVTFFMGVGVVPVHLRKWVYPGFVLFAFMVSFSRIMVGVHYPGDILTGAAYGLLCGFLVCRLYRWGEKKWLKTGNGDGYRKGKTQ